MTVHEILNLSLEEVSAVDEPANKGARIVLLKMDSPATRIAGLQARIAKLQSDISTMKAAAPVAPVRKEPTMADQNSVYAAMVKAAHAVHPGLNEAQAVDRFAQSDTGQLFYGLYNTATGIAKAGNLVTRADAEATLDALAARISKAEGCTFEQAYDKALTQNPELYIR